MDAFIEIGVAEELKEETCLIIEKYVYEVYGKKNLEDIDEVQTQIFVEKYRQIDVNERLKFIRKFDGSMIPPYKLSSCRKDQTNTYLSYPSP